MPVLAHVSDLHLDGTAARRARTRAVVERLLALPGRIDAVLVTGDITDHGEPGEYREFIEIAAPLAERVPVHCCPGNHDRRDAFREVLLGEGPVGEATDDVPVNRVHRMDDLIVAMCDSTIPGESGGHLADGTLSWLDDVLLAAPPDTPVLVACHHPPAPLYSPWLDSIGQHEPDRFGDLVGHRPNVAGVLCGHAHTAAATTFAGRALRVAPGVASTLRLPWEGAEIMDVDQPPAIAFHVVDGRPRDWRLVTHYRTIALS